MPNLTVNTEALDTPMTLTKDNSLLGILKTIPQLPQRQDSTDAQLKDLRMFANKLGMYDAENILKNLTDGKR